MQMHISHNTIEKSNVTYVPCNVTIIAEVQVSYISYITAADSYLFNTVSARLPYINGAKVNLYVALSNIFSFFAHRQPNEFMNSHPPILHAQGYLESHRKGRYTPVVFFFVRLIGTSIYFFRTVIFVLKYFYTEREYYAAKKLRNKDMDLFRTRRAKFITPFNLDKGSTDQIQSLRSYLSQ